MPMTSSDIFRGWITLTNILEVAIFIMSMMIIYKVTPHVTWIMYNWIRRRPNLK